MSQLLVEFFPLQYDKQQVLNEIASSPNGTIKIKGVLQRADAENQNSRVYPKSILMREAAKYDKDFIQQRRACGELDHPESTVVNLKNVSHNVLEMHWEGDDLMGTIEVLTTPNGNIVRELMKNGIRIGVSSRGVGSVKNLGEGKVEVEEDFSLIAFDLVSNPSTQGAFLHESAGAVKNPYGSVEKLIHDFLSEINVQ